MQTITALRVNVFSVGPFGRAVATYLKAFEPDMMETECSDERAPFSEECSQGGINVMASWRPVPRLCEHLDKFSSAARRPFVPLVLESNVLRLGPIIIPGEEGCWLCWEKRSAQHAAAPDDRAAVLEYYSAHAGAGPKGYLEPFALIGAINIKQVVDLLRSSNQCAGHIRQIDLVTRQIKTGVLVGIHNCPRCGLGREGPIRSIDEMRRCLRIGQEFAENRDRGCV
jgi:bacteriocin biosynthesis cyclodehydratase domain-containing protein